MAISHALVGAVIFFQDSFRAICFYEFIIFLLWMVHNLVRQIFHSGHLKLEAEAQIWRNGQPHQCLLDPSHVVDAQREHLTFFRRHQLFTLSRCHARPLVLFCRYRSLSFSGCRRFFSICQTDGLFAVLCCSKLLTLVLNNVLFDFFRRNLDRWLLMLIEEFSFVLTRSSSRTGTGCLLSLYAEIAQIKSIDVRSITRRLASVAKSANDEYKLLACCWICEICGRVEVCRWKDVEWISTKV